MRIVSDTLNLQPNYEPVLENNDIYAVRQDGRVEIWDADGMHHYGNVPENVTAEDVKRYMLFYERGRNAGIEEGKDQLRTTIRRDLGL